MEMQFFILGHVILLAMVVCMVLHVFYNDDNGGVLGRMFSIAAIFIPLEIIYWVLHWWLVP